MAGRDSAAASGSQVCTGHERRLDREGDEEADEQPAARCRPAGAARPGWSTRKPSGTAGPDDVEPDDGREHDQPAGEREQQELHRGILPARPAELADEEVDRDEHRLEEDVEQEDVGRREHADHEGRAARA